jgi:hypothetical protein
LPTEQAICQAIETGKYGILHMITHTESCGALSYGAIALSSTEKHPRYYYVKHFVSIFDCLSPLELVVLQASSRGPHAFDKFGDALVAKGVPAAICVPYLRSTSLRAFFATLYGGLTAERTLVDLARAFSGLAAETGDEAFSRISFHSRETGTSWFFPHAATSGQTDQRSDDETISRPPALPDGSGDKKRSELPPTEVTTEGLLHSAPFRLPYPSANQIPVHLRRELEQKYRNKEFDVFLSHNSHDKPQVKQLATELLNVGILPWLDEWELQPGRLWQPFIYEQLGKAKSAIVCIGSSEINNWQEQEVNILLDQLVKRKAPVIPVFLRDAPKDAQAPIFLRAMLWVDFRKQEPPPLQQLIWAITGQRSPFS